MDEDKRQAIEDLIEIRDTGLFNMFLERGEVLQYANKNNYFNLVAYCENNISKYDELLDEDWSEISG